MKQAELVSPAVERAVAALLGAGDDTTHAAVAALARAGRLGEGIALHALLHAARSGTDAAGALHDIAGGATFPAGWSDYERRVAAEEVADELTFPEVGTGAGAVVVAAGPDAPLLAVRSLAAGASAVASTPEVAVAVDGLALPRAHSDAAFIARLTRRCGARLVPRTGDTGRPPRTALDETVARERAYLDVLSTR